MLETEKAFASRSEEYVEVSLRQDPVAATASGIHDYDHQLPDHSPDGLRARGAWLRDFDQRLVAGVPWQELPTAQKVDFALLRSRLATARAELEELKSFERDPRRAIETALTGIHLLAARPFAPIEERKEPLLARLMAVPEFLEGSRMGLSKPTALGVELALEAAAQAPGFIDDVVRMLLRTFPGEAERIEHAGSRARIGFIEHQQALEREIAPRATTGFAIGARWMDWRLEHEHLVGFRCADLDGFGREHVARALEELELEARSLAPGRPWPDQIREAETRQPEALRLREAYVTEVERARAFVAEKRLAPETPAPIEVIEAPVFAPSAWVTYHASGAFDEDRTGWLEVTPIDPGRARDGVEATLRAHCRAAIALTAAHAAYPGHHLQRSIAQGNGSRLRRLADSPILFEGWALHAEDVMGEHGFAGDPAGRLFQLRNLLVRACGVVVDVALQTGQMTLAMAADYLVETAGIDRADAEREVRSYALRPTRALSALLGKTMLTELRDETRRRLGARFNLHDFHAALLASGSVPPSLIREELPERLK